MGRSLVNAPPCPRSTRPKSHQALGCHSRDTPNRCGIKCLRAWAGHMAKFRRGRHLTADRAQRRNICECSSRTLGRHHHRRTRHRRRHAFEICGGVVECLGPNLGHARRPIILKLYHRFVKLILKA